MNKILYKMAGFGGGLCLTLNSMFAYKAQIDKYFSSDGKIVLLFGGTVFFGAAIYCLFIFLHKLSGEEDD